MRLIYLRPRTTIGRAPAVVFFWLVALCAMPVRGQQAVLPRQTGPSLPLTTDHEQILTRAREILTNSALSEAEREVRLRVLNAVLTGTVIRPDDDYPEMRNPQHWRLVNDVFVVAPGSNPVEAIADLWAPHENDGVPIPRIRCFKYSSLILIQGHIQCFRETGNAAGLAALERLLSLGIIPEGLPNGGDGLLWKRHQESRRLLPGDQVWFDNPFFERGRELICREAYQQAIAESKPPEEAVAAAAALTDSLTAGEEGSNVFCLGDDRFARGASSLSRLCRAAFQRGGDGPAAHEQVLTPKILTLRRFQQHMIDDNYTAQACLRADPAAVRPETFTIEWVRSPIGPENLLRLYGNAAPSSRSMATSAVSSSAPSPPASLPQGEQGVITKPPRSQPLEKLIDAMASRNKPPRLVTAGDTTVPLFDDSYHWSEQNRVRAAIDAVLSIKTDDSWWRLRACSGDSRYVLTATCGRVAKNFTVGMICDDVVDLRLCLGFTAHLPSVPGRLPASFQPEQEYWQHEAQWARERTPLYAMQAALCARAIGQWDRVQGTLPGIDGRSYVYSADQKSHYIAALKKEIAERNQTKKPRYEEVVVPWLPAPGGWEGFDAERALEVRAEYESKTARTQ